MNNKNEKLKKDAELKAQLKLLDRIIIMAKFAGNSPAIPDPLDYLVNYLINLEAKMKADLKTP